jgi:hypothetical protein
MIARKRVGGSTLGLLADVGEEAGSLHGGGGGGGTEVEGGGRRSKARKKDRSGRRQEELCGGRDK